MGRWKAPILCYLGKFRNLVLVSIFLREQIFLVAAMPSESFKDFYAISIVNAARITLRKTLIESLDRCHLIYSSTCLFFTGL